MAARIPVLLKKHRYDVIVGNGILPRTGDFVRQTLPSTQCALITDAQVAPLYGGIVRESLEEAGIRTTVITIPPGELSKSLVEAERICEALAAAHLDRGGLVVALGGGVVGDLAGFAASIYYRGIPHVQIPTTVVAQVDSSIGGKTGVNLRSGKNLVGAFHQPALVITDPETLQTLPKREFNEGVAEIIKHGIIRDETLLDEVAEIVSTDLPSLIARNVKIKALIVGEDEFENHSLRALLNFGHTVGHAIENSAGYGRYLHGEAISLGLVAALALSEKKAGLSADATRKVIDLLCAFDLPVTLPPDISTDSLMTALQRDKKFEDGAVRFVLTKKFGSAFVSSDVTTAEIREAIEALKK